MHHQLRLLLFIASLLPCLSLVTQAQPKLNSCTPNLRFGSVLKAVQISADGRLQLSEMVATCLPDPTRSSNSNYPYDPDGGGTLSTNTVVTLNCDLTVTDSSIDGFVVERRVAAEIAPRLA